MQLSKNVIRSMKTEIRNRRTKAAKYTEMGIALNLQADKLQTILDEHGGDVPEKTAAPTPIEQAIEQAGEQVHSHLHRRKA